jgi:hypothetical protein
MQLLSVRPVTRTPDHYIELIENDPVVGLETFLQDQIASLDDLQDYGETALDGISVPFLLKLYEAIEKRREGQIASAVASATAFLFVMDRYLSCLMLSIAS